MKLLSKSFSRLLCVLAFSILTFTAPASGDSRPGFVDIAEATATIEEALSQGVLSTNQELSRLGDDVKVALEVAQGGDDFYYSQFSAQSNIEMLYRRAEAHEAGQGDRFLARLKASLAEKSAAVSEDPRLKFLDNPALAPQKPIVFAAISTLDEVSLTSKLSPAAEEAITLLSEHCSPKGIAHIKANIIRNLRLDAKGNVEKSLKKFDVIVRSARTRRAVLAALVLAHNPPPKMQVALRKIIMDFATTSGAFAVDPAVAKVMSSLSAELTEVEKKLVSEIPGSLAERYLVNVADGGLPVVKTAAKISDIIEKAPQIATPIGELPFPAWNPPLKDSLAQKHQKYVVRSFEPPLGLVAAPDTVSKLVPRKFSKAILSSRAARGIAAGALVTDNVYRLPLKAYWISDPASDQFGRFVISFSPCFENWWKPLWNMLGQCDGEPIVAVSVRLYTDSFLAANQLLWGNHSVETEFVDGDITVLMSMDPNLTHEGLEPLLQQKKGILADNEALVKRFRLAQKAIEQIFAKYGRPRNDSEHGFLLWMMRLPKEDQSGFIDAGKTLKELDPSIEALDKSLKAKDVSIEVLLKQKFRHVEIPRGIVYHPALHGHYLTWSAARVDFWRNDTKRLFEEAGEIAGNMESATKMKAIFDGAVVGASTWQYYEVDSVLQLDQNAVPPIIQVQRDANPDGKFDPEARFSITLFKSDNTDTGAIERDLEIIPSADIHEPLDWLQHHHPDFRRLRDFSTALTLLRYLKSYEIKLISLSLDDQTSTIATPEWIFGGAVEPVVNPLKLN